MQLLHHDIPQSSSAVTVASAAASSSSSSSPALLQGSTRMRSVSHSNFGYSNSNNYNNYHNLSYPSPVQSGGIRKKPTSSSRHRAVSTSYAAERLHQLALEQQQTTALDFLQQYQQESIPTATDLNWFTPQHSPEPTCFFQEPVQLENQFHWAAPTPPHSDSGIPTLPADVCDEASAQVSSPDSFAFDQVTAAPDMSSLEYLLPSYSNVAFPAQGNNASFDENYPMRTQPPTSASQYGSTVSSSPQFHQTRTATPARRISPNGQPTPPYGLPSRRLNSYETTPQSNYSMPALMPGPSTAPIPSSTPMTQFGGMTRSPALYDAQFYNLTYTTAQPVPQTYAPASDSTYQQGQRASEAAKASTDARGTARCYDHGCNGRRFSTFSNLLRHQREKSGTASKSTCHKCGAEFTRTTARNGHLAHDKCTKGPRITQQ